MSQTSAKTILNNLPEKMEIDNNSNNNNKNQNFRFKNNNNKQQSETRQTGYNNNNNNKNKSPYHYNKYQNVPDYNQALVHYISNISKKLGDNQIASDLKKII